MRIGVAAAVMLSVLACARATTTADEVEPRRPASEGATCGTIVGIPCADGLWCELPPGQCTGADLAGTCVAAPQVCTRDWRPVCGCDGKTYGNDCTRRAARQPKDHDGECMAKAP